MAANSGTQSETIGLRRTLRFRDLILYGIILIQPTAPMPVFGRLHGWRHGRWSQIIPMLIALAGMATCAVLWWNLSPKAKLVGTCWAIAGILLWVARRRFTVLPQEAA
jgi:hypothetical protein